MDGKGKSVGPFWWLRSVFYYHKVGECVRVRVSVFRWLLYMWGGSEGKGSFGR